MKKTLRFTGILFMALTSVATILGGAGTTCVALNPGNYGPKFAPIAEYQWLYILYVLVGVALGVLGVRVTLHLIKRRENAERSALIVLVAGLIVGVIHMITSRALRGSSMPVDGVVYITALTLIIFLIFRLPRIQELGLYQPGDSQDGNAAGGVVSYVTAAMILSVQMWAQAGHLIDGKNYANAFQATLVVVGVAFLVIGTALFIKGLLIEGTAIQTRLRS